MGLWSVPQFLPLYPVSQSAVPVSVTGKATFSHNFELDCRGAIEEVKPGAHGAHISVHVCSVTHKINLNILF